MEFELLGKQNRFAVFDLNEKTAICKERPTCVSAQREQVDRSTCKRPYAYSHHLHEMSHDEQGERIPWGKARRIAVQARERGEHIAPMSQSLVRHLGNFGNLFWSQSDHIFIVFLKHLVVDNKMDRCQDKSHRLCQ